MDWQGQKLSEQLMQYFLLASAAVSFLTGFFLSSYRIMLIVYMSGVLITFIATVPEWPFFNRHALEWNDPPTIGTPRSKLLRSRQQEAAKKIGQVSCEKIIYMAKLGFLPRDAAAWFRHKQLWVLASFYNMPVISLTANTLHKLNFWRSLPQL